MNLLDAIKIKYVDEKLPNMLEDIIQEQKQIVEVPVDSSWIDDVVYNDVTQTMSIDTAENGRYTYFNVSPQLFSSFEQASSKGAFINLVIKNGIHPFIRG